MKKERKSSLSEKEIEKIEAGIEEKRAELEKKLGVKVHAYYFNGGEHGMVVGYLKEPIRDIKRQVLDLGKLGHFTQASQILIQTSLIKEESSPLILSEDQAHDMIVLGFEQSVLELVTYYTNTQKKS